MQFETFAFGNSFIHQLDPRIRLVCAVFCAFSIALLHDVLSAAAGLGLGCALVAAAALPPLVVLRRLVPLNLFVLLVWVVLPFSVPGEAVCSIGPFGASLQGFSLALLITLKSNAIILTSLALACTMQVAVLVRAMEALRLPGKFCQVIFFSLRYFQVIHREYRRLSEAMTARAFVPRTNLHTFKTYGYLISMLLVRSLNRGQRVYEAMLCRGYTGSFPALRQFRLVGRDIIFLVFCLVALAGLWAMDIYFYRNSL